MTKDTLFAVQQITFEQILPIWQNKLWLNRVSKIETHSAMTWPFSHPDQPYDMTVFTYPVYFFGIYDQDKLIAVNSGHLTTDQEFRSRGLWVDPDYRGQKLAQQILLATIDQARESGAKMIWSIPRLTALPAYEKVGFKTVGDRIDEGVEFGPNIYCHQKINTVYDTLYP
jgi:GNAT superfamily N-acetyltransferase